MKLSRTAVGDMTTPESTTIYQAPEKLAQDQHLEGLPLGSHGGLRVEYDFPLDAEYRFSIRGNNATQSNANFAIDFALDGRRVENQHLSDFRMHVDAGRHVLTAALFEVRQPTGVNDIYSVYKWNAGIDRVEIAGPFNATGLGDTESRRRIFSCHPQSKAQERGCAERILVDMASRAFRAPKQLGDLADIMRFYERGHDEGGFEVGIQQALSRILIDPRFLFRFEAQPGDAAPGTHYTVTRACPSSCGAASLTRSCLISQRRTSCTGPRCSPRRCDACSWIARPTRWWRTSPGSGCICGSSRR
jgi:hypothetical protein